MNFRTLSIIATLLLLAVFTLMNWGAFVAPSTLTLGFAEIQAPLGLIMIGVTGLVGGLLLVYILFQQAAVIMESRRMAKELKGQRELADKAEASRFTEMRGFIEGELRRLEGQAAASTRELGERLERVDQELKQQLVDVSSSLAAQIGEVEDKLDRALPPRDPA